MVVFDGGGVVVCGAGAGGAGEALGVAELDAVVGGAEQVPVVVDLDAVVDELARLSEGVVGRRRGRAARGLSGDAVPARSRRVGARGASGERAAVADRDRVVGGNGHARLREHTAPTRGAVSQVGCNIPIVRVADRDRTSHHPTGIHTGALAHIDLVIKGRTRTGSDRLTKLIDRLLRSPSKRPRKRRRRSLGHRQITPTRTHLDGDGVGGGEQGLVVFDGGGVVVCGAGAGGAGEALGVAELDAVVGGAEQVPVVVDLNAVVDELARLSEGVVGRRRGRAARGLSERHCPSSQSPCWCPRRQWRTSSCSRPRPSRWRERSRLSARAHSSHPGRCQPDRLQHPNRSALLTVIAPVTTQPESTPAPLLTSTL